MCRHTISNETIHKKTVSLCHSIYQMIGSREKTEDALDAYPLRVYITYGNIPLWGIIIAYTNDEVNYGR